MIRVRGVGKAYGDRDVLRGVSFDVERGERVALLGVNGAGKTTLLRCMLGLASYDGLIEIDGLDARERGVEARSRVGYVPQRAPVSDLTAGDFVHLVAGLRRVPVDAVRERLASLGLDLDGEADKPLKALSGGMLQKTLLALVLADGAGALLLDEPTGNLDPRARRDFLDAIGRVDERTSVILASHRLSDVRAIADRILVLHRGRIAFDGGVHDLRGHAGAPGSLWVQVPDDRREAARELLTRDGRAMEVYLNGGSQLRVRARPGDRADLVAALRRGGIPVEDVRTEEEPLENVLAHLAGEGGAAPAADAQEDGR